MENFNIDTAVLIDLAINYGTKLLAAIVTLVIGLWIAGIITRVVKRLMERGKVDPSLCGFLSSMIAILLKVLVYITALGVLGIEMTSFVAILGAAGLAVGLALSGTLQNFAGGVMILLFKPFRVGDVIDAQGFIGSVKEIQIFVTILTTPDNKTIIIPNGPLSTSSMTNFSTQATRRVDFLALPEGQRIGVIEMGSTHSGRSLRELDLPVRDEGRGDDRVITIDPRWRRTGVQLSLSEVLSLHFGRKLFDFLEFRSLFERLSEAP